MTAAERIAQGNPALGRRAGEIFTRSHRALCVRADHLFSWLLAAQWACGILIALFYTPYVWSGATRSTNPHVWEAILLGSLITVFPILLARIAPGEVLTRHVIAASQLLWSSLLIHLTGGRIETHFHVFCSLAILAFYRDWKVLVPGTCIVLVDHILRGVLWPESVYGVLEVQAWRFLEHGFWVMFENAFLFVSISRSRSEMWTLAVRQSELEQINTEVERQIAERTEELLAANQELVREARERRSAHQAMEQLASIVRDSSDAVFVVGAEERISSWNAGARELFKTPAVDAVGNTPEQVFPPRVAAELAALRARARAGERLGDLETAWVTRDGARVEVELRVSKLALGAAIDGAVSFVARDVSDRNRTLRRTELSSAVNIAMAECATLSDVVPRLLRAICAVHGWAWGALWALDKKSRVLRLSECWADPGSRLDRLEAVSREVSRAPGVGIVGRGWELGRAVWLPDARENLDFRDRVSRGGADLRAAVAFPILIGSELVGVFEFLDGVERQEDHELLGLLEEIGAQVGQFLERRRAEAQLMETHRTLSGLVSASPLAIVLVDAELRVRLWNPEAERVFGWSSEELVGRPYPLVPEGQQSASDEMVDAVRAGQRLGHVETRRRTRDGALVDVVMHVSPLLDAHGAVRGGLIFFVDITERKLMAAQLAQAQKLEAIGQLAAGIAHEINTPTQYVSDNVRFLRDAFAGVAEVIAAAEAALAGSPGSTDALRAALQDSDMAYLREEVPRALQQSLEGLDRVTTIVRAMKDFSHPGSAERKPLDLNRAIVSTLTVARNEYKYVADMVLQLAPDLPAVPCYAGELNQAVLNLVVNAAHAIESVVGKSGGRGTITVATRLDGDWAEIRVGDTGTGIPEAVRQRVFEPFFTTKEVGRGTGQGLAITHNVVVKKHGGTINFETEVGKGTAFILRLPLVARAAPVSDAPPPAAAPELREAA